MKSLLGKLGVILIGLTILGYTEVWGVDWKYYGANEDGSFYYETESMTRLSKNLIKVWVQSAYTEEGISHWVRAKG